MSTHPAPQVGCLAVLTALNWQFAARYSDLIWRTRGLQEELPTLTMRITVTAAGACCCGIPPVWGMCLHPCVCMHMCVCMSVFAWVRVHGGQRRAGSILQQVLPRTGQPT